MKNQKLAQNRPQPAITNTLFIFKNLSSLIFQLALFL